MNKSADKPSKSHFETQVSTLYQQRKRRLRATAKMKRQVFQHRDIATNWTGLFSRFQQVAIAAGTLLLISLIALQTHQLRQFTPKIEYTSVTVHSFEETTDQDYAQIKSLYQQHTDNYLSQKQLLASHHQQSAVLSQFENGWELKTCDQALVKMSKELVAALQDMDLISRNLKSGDSVQIAYNVGGLIVSIQPAMSHQQCS